MGAARPAPGGERDVTAGGRGVPSMARWRMVCSKPPDDAGAAASRARLEGTRGSGDFA